MIEFAFNGLDAFKAQLDRLDKALQGQVVQDALMAGAYIIEGYAKTLVPVDTGFLRSSIQAARGEDNSAVVAAQAEYAAYVEYGTSRMSAQPYMRPAMDEHRPEIEQAITDNLVAGLEKAGA